PTTVKNRRKMIPPVSQSCFFYVPDEFKLTIGKEQFLFIDEARVRRERFLLYCKLNSRVCCNHPNVWTLINCMKAEENHAQSIKLQWSSGASKPKNKRTTALQSPIDTLYDRHNNYFISTSDLLNSLFLIVAKKKV
ncbi:unnamed protein product, partial [Rotaria sp. Silwood2]